MHDDSSGTCLSKECHDLLYINLVLLFARTDLYSEWQGRLCCYPCHQLGQLGGAAQQGSTQSTACGLCEHATTALGWKQ
jgi:hypothetical protein